MNEMSLNKKLHKIQDEVEKIHSLSGFNTAVNNNKRNIYSQCIPSSAVKNPIDAIFFRSLALNIKFGLNEETKIKWQHYWLKCCLSEECDYVFSILGSKEFDIDREDDLIKILNEGVVWNQSTLEGRRYYALLTIKFLLKRYNLFDSFILYYHLLKDGSFVNLLLPRMLSAILIGFVAIATSEEIWIFASDKLSELIIYGFIMISISASYLWFECSNKCQRVLSINKLLSRVGAVFFFGLSFSSLFCIMFAKIGLFDPGSFSGNEWCWTKIFFYSTLAYFIGIIVQLLWEDKAMTEPL